MIALTALSAVDASAVERQLDLAFGIDRQQRTAYRVRANIHSLPEMSFAALEDGALVGSIQCWPVAHLADNGVETPLVMVGPVAVTPARQGDGLGRRLMDAALAANDGYALMLIGDPEYYARFFGFTADRTPLWRLPGPFDPRRLLARGDDVPASAGVIASRGAGAGETARLTPIHADGCAA